MSAPARPGLIFRSIDEMLADAEKLRTGSYVKSGQWDLPMILDHLAKAMQTPSPDQKPIPWPFNILARFVISRLVRLDVYPLIKFPASKAMRPAPNIDLATANASFVAAAEQIKSFPGPMVGGTPYGAVRLSDFVKLHLMHGAHHLSFLSPV